MNILSCRDSHLRLIRRAAVVAPDGPGGGVEHRFGGVGRRGEDLVQRRERTRRRRGEKMKRYSSGKDEVEVQRERESSVKKCILFEYSHLHVHLEKLVVVQDTQPLQPHDKLDASLRDHRVTVRGESDESIRETFREPETGL